MIIVTVILLILTIFCSVFTFTSDEFETWSIGAASFLILTFIAGASIVNLSLNEQHLSGYIYSSETNWTGYTTAHIRFSQNAGQDVQPEFCVKADSDAGRAISKYTGTNTKVEVDIPTYFYLSNNPWACGTTKMTITESK